ncbi:DUF4192 family protein [Agromyces sp. Marseille-P2726]|uniref:DUF4192 family protein n=1 Tax=Agromyces sp. Marseille-P2726 TaxID=2709132 RepID=UPI001570807F|nr:DUF4192 family protein [Agromyces sp. Marseille-P2726]
MTTIIRAGAPHDLLALVPALAGFLPERSVVCVAFRGNRSAGVLRHDLPRHARDRAAVVDAIIGTMCRMPGVDAIVPIVYTDATFAGAAGIPERTLLSLVVRRAEQAGFHVRDALCRAADAWGSLLDRDGPATGHPLELIDQSPAARQAPDSGAALGTASSLAELPEPDAATAGAIASELAALADERTLEARLVRLGANADPVELVESLVAPGASKQPPLRLAWFLHLAGRPPIRDAMLLQFAFGPAIGEAAHLDAEQTAARAEEEGLTVDELVCRDEEHGVLDEATDLLGRLMLGQSPLRPDVRRVERALTVVRTAIAAAPTESRCGALCIAAWLAWSIGRGSGASALLDQALAIDPGHTMAALLTEFIGSGALPEWAFAESGATGPVSAR